MTHCPILSKNVFYFNFFVIIQELQILDEWSDSGTHILSGRTISNI